MDKGCGRKMGEIAPEKGQSANNISEKKGSGKSSYVQSSIASGRATKL